MLKIYYGYFKEVLYDNRNKPQDLWDDVPFKLEDNFSGGKASVFINWDGFLVFEKDIAVFESFINYIDELSSFACCGRCFPGKFGTKILSEVIKTSGTDENIDDLLKTATNLAETIYYTSKCTTAPTSVYPLLKFLKYFKEEVFVRGKGQYNYVKHITAPCTSMCPAHIKIPEFIEEIKDYNPVNALEIIKQNMPISGVCGRVCPHPCERNCRRGLIEKAVNIMVLKRFAWDYTYYHNKKVTEALSDDKKNKNIAIIGAGPAGLSASYYLALKGYNVKIYDMLPEPGGMVAVGIPDYRQPRELLRAEVEDILSLGVGIVYNTKIGRDIPFKDIISAFDAVLIAVGAFKSHEMGVVGENEDYEGLMTSGIDFLQSIALGEKIEVGKKVIIVGGGNTAIDCARSSIRLGFDEVIIAYRRSRKEMPAEDFEVEAALEEGVKFHFLVAPQRVIAEGNKVVGLECLKMQLSEPDESGRRRPTPVAGSEFILECDTIIPAIGQYSSLDFLTLSDGIEVTKWNTIKVIDDLYMTKKEGVFAAGDCQFGPDTVVRATSEGRTAAIMMDRYLTKGYPFLEDEEKLELTIHKNKLAFNEEEKVIEPKSIDRIKQTILPVDLRRTTFEEVEKPYTEKQAYLEATRCLRCIRFAMITLNKGNVDG